jgi:gluconolactonase
MPKSGALARFGAITLLAASAAALAGMPPNAVVINKGVSFPEGPIFKGTKLYFVGYGGTGVLVWDGKASKVLFTEPKCGPTSVTTFGDDLLVACYEENVIVRIHTDGSEVSRIGKDTNGNVILAPNDFAPDPRGGVYVTGSGPPDTTMIAGKVYHISPALEVTELARDIHFANGLAVSPDGKRLLVAEAEAQRIISFSINDNGTLSDRRLFARLNKLDPEGGIDAYPDGIKFGPDGNLWIGEYSKPRVAVLSGDGKSFVRGYDLPGQACSNVAFTTDGKSVVSTCIDNKEVAPWPGTVYEWKIGH